MLDKQLFNCKWIHKSHGRIFQWAEDVSGRDRQRCPLKPPWPLWPHGHPKPATKATMALAKRCRSSDGTVELHLNQKFWMWMVWIETKNHQKSKHMARLPPPQGMVERSIGHSKELKVMEVGGPKVLGVAEAVNQKTFYKWPWDYLWFLYILVIIMYCWPILANMLSCV